MTDSISSQQGCHPDCDQVVINIEKMIQAVPYLPPSRDCCIHKVPVRLRNINEAAYTPQIISIGPLHRDDKKLQPMQAHKVSFLNTILRRNPSIKLEDYVKTLRGLEKQVRNSYFNQEFVCSISSDDFVEMMLLDGCFIVVYLISGYNGTDEGLLPMPYDNTVISDLKLYENQLPYFLLEHLFNFINGDNPICAVSFFDLVAAHFCYDLNEKEINRLKNSSYQVKHILDFILNCHRPSSDITILVNDNNTERKDIYLASATELHESGVEFKKGESDCYLDIKSYKNGVLEIPVLDVDDISTEREFRNMIAMEQCQKVNNSTNAYITHYTILMDFLINTPKDVALLRSSKIINNYMGSDEAVVEMFNKLGTGVTVAVNESPYYEHLENMDAFYNRRWNRWKANLRRNYFQNPWTIASLIAAIVLLICTIAQTVFSFISLFQ